MWRQVFQEEGVECRKMAWGAGLRAVLIDMGQKRNGPTNHDGKVSLNPEVYRSHKSVLSRKVT